MNNPLNIDAKGKEQEEEHGEVQVDDGKGEQLLLVLQDPVEQPQQEQQEDASPTRTPASFGLSDAEFTDLMHRKGGIVLYQMADGLFWCHRCHSSNPITCMFLSFQGVTLPGSFMVNSSCPAQTRGRVQRF